MADLRITGVSNNQLELQAPDGTRHYLEISDDLLKALRTREVSLPESVTPREIQQLVRLGSTVSEVVSKTGADQELVERFAKPILAELNHIVSLARNIRLSLAGDRFAEPSLVEFGSVMDERLVNNGAREILWSSRKSVEGDWLVTASFITSSGSGFATWSFDPKQLFLAPENETALQLSNGVPISITKTVPIVQEVEIQVDEPEEQHIHPTVMLSVVPEIAPTSVDETISEPSEDLFEEVTSTGSVLRVVEELSTTEVIAQVQETPHTSEILDTVLNTSEMQEASDPVQETPEESANEVGTITENPNRPQSSSRWAEVLFGSKEDEEENN